MSDFKEMSTQKDIELSKLLNERDTLENKYKFYKLKTKILMKIYRKWNVKLHLNLKN